MAAEFGPYYEWHGIAPKDQPLHTYRLLGIDLYEDDPRVIENSQLFIMIVCPECLGRRCEH